VCHRVKGTAQALGLVGVINRFGLAFGHMLGNLLVHLGKGVEVMAQGGVVMAQGGVVIAQGGVVIAQEIRKAIGDIGNRVANLGDKSVGGMVDSVVCHPPAYNEVLLTGYSPV